MIRFEERCEELERERAAAAREYHERTAEARAAAGRDVEKYDAWAKEHAEELRPILLREERAECMHDELQRGYRAYLHRPEALAEYCSRRIQELEGYIKKLDGPERGRRDNLMWWSIDDKPKSEEVIAAEKRKLGRQIEAAEEMRRTALVEAAVINGGLSLRDGVITPSSLLTPEAVKFIKENEEAIKSAITGGERYEALRVRFESGNGCAELEAAYAALDALKEKYPAGAAYIEAKRLSVRSGEGSYTASKLDYSIRRLVEGAVRLKDFNADIKSRRRLIENNEAEAELE